MASYIKGATTLSQNKGFSKASLQNQHQKDSQKPRYKTSTREGCKGDSEISLKVNSQDLGKVRL